MTHGSRPHRSGDIGLVESKNGSIIRKHIGSGCIWAQHAEAIDRFHRAHLKPTSISPAVCGTVLTVAMGNAAGSISFGPHPWELFANCRSARGSCALASVWPSWSVARTCNPTPKLHWPCGEPNANCSADSKGNKLHEGPFRRLPLVGYARISLADLVN